MFAYIFCKQIAEFFLPSSTRLSSNIAWLDSARSTFYQSLARLSSAREATGSTQLNSRNCWLEPSLRGMTNIVFQDPDKNNAKVLESELK